MSIVIRFAMVAKSGILIAVTNWADWYESIIGLISVFDENVVIKNQPDELISKLNLEKFHYLISVSLNEHPWTVYIQK